MLGLQLRLKTGKPTSSDLEQNPFGMSMILHLSYVRWPPFIMRKAWIDYGDTIMVTLAITVTLASFLHKA